MGEGAHGRVMQLGRKGARPSLDDATKALYVHLASDGGIFAVRGTGEQAWLTQAQLDDELSKLRESGGRLIYSRDDPERDPPQYVDDVFKRMIDSRPAGVQLLETAHPVPAAHAKHGLTVLMMSAHQGHVDRLVDLIARGVPLEARSQQGYTALTIAVNNGMEECARLLLEAGADPNARDKQSSTPLMFAAHRGSDEMVRLLLEHGADAAVRGDHRFTAADFARQNGHESTLRLLQGASRD